MLANTLLLVSLLSPNERKKFYSLIVFVSVVALLEALGLASVFPVLTFIMRPDILETNDVMQLIYHYFGFSSASFFSAALALSAILIFNFSQFAKALSFHRQNKFFLNQEAKISTNQNHFIGNWRDNAPRLFCFDVLYIKWFYNHFHSYSAFCS